MMKQGVLTLTGWHLANFVLNSHGTANLRQIHSRKNPLNHPMDKRSRRRRVEEKRDTLQTWALEEGFPVRVSVVPGKLEFGQSLICDCLEDFHG